jgi:hypothetical protein
MVATAAGDEAEDENCEMDEEASEHAVEGNEILLQ